MSLHRLDNARWGFSSNCFVCESSNVAGLRISFVHDDEADVVSARFSLGEAFSGAPNYVHGGIVLAVMDEAMAWTAIAVAHTWALTRETTTTFFRPVVVNEPHTVVASLVGRGADETLRLSASVFRGDLCPGGLFRGDLCRGGLIRGDLGASRDGDRCAEARSTFVPLSPEGAAAAVGEAPTPDHRSYLRQRPS